jgi:hypothetical protein
MQSMRILIGVMEILDEREIKCLVKTLWHLGMRNRGKGEYYHSLRYTLFCDRWEDNLEVTRNGKDKKKIIGYNPERGVLNWYGDEQDFNRLWNLILTHDEKWGIDWYVS